MTSWGGKWRPEKMLMIPDPHVPSPTLQQHPHHRLKTAGVWTCSTTDGGFTIEWQGPGGARYTTRATGPLAEAYDPDRPLTFDDPDDPEEPDGPEAPPD